MCEMFSKISQLLNKTLFKEEFSEYKITGKSAILVPGMGLEPTRP